MQVLWLYGGGIMTVLNFEMLKLRGTMCKMYFDIHERILSKNVERNGCKMRLEEDLRYAKGGCESFIDRVKVSRLNHFR